MMGWQISEMAVPLDLVTRGVLRALESSSMQKRMRGSPPRPNTYYSVLITKRRVCNLILAQIKESFS